MKINKLKFIITSYILVSIMIIFGCSKSPSTTLSPAREIIGTWKSLVPVTVYEVTNLTSCTNVSSNYTYATFQCKFTFVFSQTPGDTLLIVHVYGDTISGKYPVCGVRPPIEDGYPLEFNGKVSSSALTLLDVLYTYNSSNTLSSGLHDVGDFTFTSSLLTGKISWIDYSQVGGSSIGWKTDQISLTKQ